jgi:hypothetical protein
MPLYIFELMLGAFCLGIGIAYIVSPRFVEWMLTKDRTGQMWVRRLGRERAIFAMRRVFSVVLIAFGICLLYFSYANYWLSE